MNPVKKYLIGLTDLAKQIADEEAESLGMNRSEWIEWLIVSQRFPASEVKAIWSRRRQRGGRGVVRVLPDNAVLPPEG